jgi:hypothetical protein
MVAEGDRGHERRLKSDLAAQLARLAKASAILASP